MPGAFYDVEQFTVCGADERYPRHSEASIIELADGALLLAWQRFEKSEFGSGDEAPSTICIKKSTDGGRTWGPDRIVAAREEGEKNVYSPNFLRLFNGDILLIYMKYVQLIPGLPQLSTAYKMRSRDEGETFSQPEILWERERFGISNDCIRRLKSGRVILPVTYSEGEMWAKSEKIHIQMLYSDDECAAFRHAGHKIELPMRGAMEPFAAQRADGSLLMVMRSQLGSLFMAESFDEGLTFTKPQTSGLRAPESCPFIIRVPNSDKLLVVWNNSEYDLRFSSHYGKRTPLTAALTGDGGRTFADFWDIQTHPGVAFSNPGATFTSDGRCLLTYWACPYDKKWMMRGLIDLKMTSFRIKA